MDPEWEIESILGGIYQSRLLGKKNTTDCFVCGKAGKHFRENDREKRFCSGTCHKVEHLASQCFQLGMKRSARAIELGDEGLEEWRLIQFPNEVQAVIILLAFDYRINNDQEWEQLKKIGLVLDKRHTTIIETLVIPNLHEIDSTVLSHLTLTEVQQLKGLQKLELPLMQSGSDFWPDVVTTLRNLVDLDVRYYSGSQFIQSEKMTNLTRLVCGRDTVDQNLNGLVKLKQLVLSGERSKITDTGLFYVSNIQSLEIRASDVLMMKQMEITPDGLRNLSSLQQVVFDHVDSRVVTEQRLQALSNITELHMIHSDIQNIQTFTNLTTLKVVSPYNYRIFSFPLTNDLTKLSLKQISYIHSSDIYRYTKLVKLKLCNTPHVKSIDDQLVEFFGKLSDLEKLDISQNMHQSSGLQDRHVSLLTSLKSLNLGNNKVITDRGISTLTNLTTINLRNNNLISNKSLRRLKSLQLIQENRRTYRREPDDLTFY